MVTFAGVTCPSVPIVIVTAVGSDPLGGGVVGAVGVVGVVGGVELSPPQATAAARAAPS